MGEGEERKEGDRGRSCVRGGAIRVEVYSNTRREESEKTGMRGRE